jgi:hypothetical protein
MTTLSDACSLIKRLVDATGRINDNLSANELVEIHGQLLLVHVELGKEFARKFNGKEKAKLQRIISSEGEYQRIRKADQKRNIRDADGDSKLFVAEEYQKEIDAGTEFLEYQQLLRSVENAMPHCSQVISMTKDK